MFHKQENTALSKHVSIIDSLDSFWSIHFAVLSRGFRVLGSSRSCSSVFVFVFWGLRVRVLRSSCSCSGDFVFVFWVCVSFFKDFSVLFLFSGIRDVELKSY